MADEVFYLVMPSVYRAGRRAQGSHHQPGDLHGLADAAAYIASLGVTSIVTTPVFASAAHHGYQHGKPTAIEPRLGGDEAMARLLQAARAEGLKVLIDFVAYGVDPRTLRDAERSGIAWENAHRSRATGYAYRSLGTRPVRFAHWNLNDARVRRRVIDWARWWIDDNNPLAVDGFRFDHVWRKYPSDGARRADKLAPGSPPWAEGWGYHLDGFWAPMAEALRASRPEATLLAEPAEWHTTGAALLDVFDAAISKPALFALRDAVAGSDSATWHAALDSTEDRSVVCTGDHDVDRVASACGRGSHRAALALALLSPGPVLLYAGDELGVPGRRLHRLGGDAGDLGRRLGMRWLRTPGWPDASPRALSEQAARRLGPQVESVEAQAADPGSTLSLTRALLAERGRRPEIRRGAPEPVDAPAGVWAQRRRLDDRCCEIRVNLTGQTVRWPCGRTLEGWGWCVLDVGGAALP